MSEHFVTTFKRRIAELEDALAAASASAPTVAPRDGVPPTVLLLDRQRAFWFTSREASHGVPAGALLDFLASLACDLVEPALGGRESWSGPPPDPLVDGVPVPVSAHVLARLERTAARLGLRPDALVVDAWSCTRRWIDPMRVSSVWSLPQVAMRLRALAA